MTPVPEGLTYQLVYHVTFRSRLTAMQDFPNYSYACSLNESRPKVFPDVLDGIDSQCIHIICLDQVLYPTIERIDDMWILSVEVRHTVAEPAWSSATIDRLRAKQTNIVQIVAGPPSL